MKLTIDTAKGPIEVIESTDPNFPGVFISINGKKIVQVELDGEDHAIRIWDSTLNNHLWDSNKFDDSDYIYKQIVKSKPWHKENEEFNLVVQHILDYISTFNDDLDDSDKISYSDDVIYQAAARHISENNGLIHNFTIEHYLVASVNEKESESND